MPQAEARRLYKAQWYQRNRERMALRQKERFLITRENGRRWYAKHTLRGIYEGMLYRCYNPKHRKFHCYGGRGIAVCQEWRNSYEKFESWALANGWKRGMHTDRIDNNGNYEPLNCRFVTIETNNRNRRNVKLSVADAVEIRRLSLAGNLQRDIADQFGVHPLTISKVIRGKSWKVD